MHLLVAVCTRGRPLQLQACLKSLFAMHPPPSARLELLVVENADGVSPRTRNAITAAPPPWLASAVAEPTLGIPFARNRAIVAALASGADALVFIDDDQTVPPDWLATLLNVWREENVDIVKPLVSWAFDPPAKLTEHFRARDPRGPARTPATYHMATNGVLIAQRTWKDLGIRFDTRLVHTGGSDTVFFRDALARGARAIITRETFAIEHCPAAKQTRWWLLRRAWRVGTVDALARFKGYSRTSYFLRGLSSALAHGVFALALIWRPERSFHQILRSTKGIGRMAGAIGTHPAEYRDVIGE